MFTLISMYSDIFSILQGAPLPVAPAAVCWWLTGDPAPVPVSADAPGLWVSLEHPPAWSQAWAAAWEGKLYSEMGRKHRTITVLLEEERER